MWLVIVASLAGFQIAPTRDYQVGDLPVELTVRAVDASGAIDTSFTGTAQVTGVEGISTIGPFVSGEFRLEKAHLRGDTVRVSANGISGEQTLRTLPGAFSLLPPVFAILLAIATRRALIALFAGIWLGALLINDYNPLLALLRCFDTYLPAQVGDPGNAQMILFTLALGGMVGIVTRSGGSQALVDAVSHRVRTRRSGMLASALAGIVIFFDDYANCLLVGNTVRPFTDARRISREKLSFLVDSTAAPISTLALVSTWTGYQLGLIGDAGVELPAGAYGTFLAMLPYSFYPIFMLAFVFIIAASQRDFGPMLAAERRALSTGQLVRPGSSPLQDKELTEMRPEDGRVLHWQNGAIPIAVVIITVIAGLYFVGARALGDGAANASLREIISASGDEAFKVLLWASFGGGVVGLLTALVTGALTIDQSVDAWISGVKAMTMAILILVLAWAIGDICKNHLLTGPWLLSQVRPSPHWLPVITFVVSGFIALATGSSFSTMAIVIPIAAPMVWAVTGDGSGMSDAAVWSSRYATLAAVLAGSVFGDHCSPISDTTVMSSMACAADHIDHVRTQMPYAVLCGGVAAAVGFVPSGFGISPLITLPIGIGLLAAAVFLLGRRADAP
jgi:Na+/H+ antiporter NhaC